MVTTPSASNSITPQFQEALSKVKLRAKEIIKSEPENTWRPLLRNVAAQEGIDLDIKDLDLESFLDEAERSLDPSRVYRSGDKLQATESVFMLNGLIKLGEANVIIGQPKVGKSSFSTGLVAALRDKRQQFLGRDLLLPDQRMPVLIFGTDQSEGDWLHFLKRERLVTDDQALDGSAVDFFCSLESSNDYNFTREGLRNMRAEIEKHQLPLVIIDSLSSMMEPTGIEENTSRYAQPIRNAIRELRKTGATLLIIHHSVKRPTTWDWIVECRGSSSISSVFSWGVLMRWVAQEEDGLARTDRRVGFTGKGRGSAEAGGVMAEYQDEGGWLYLDGLEAAQQVERVGQRIMELGGVRAQVFDYLSMRTELRADVPAEEVASQLNKQQSAVTRELRALKQRGLAYICRKDGKRPFWQITEAAAAFMGHSALREPERVFDVSFVSLPQENIKNMEYNSQSSTTAVQPESKKTSSDDAVPSPNGASPIAVGTPVERFKDGCWENGWVVHDGQNRDRITIAKLGSQMVLIRNMRWGIDLRECSGSPFAPATKAEPTTEEFDF